MLNFRSKAVLLLTDISEMRVVFPVCCVKMKYTGKEACPCAAHTGSLVISVAT